MLNHWVLLASLFFSRFFFKKKFLQLLIILELMSAIQVYLFCLQDASKSVVYPFLFVLIVGEGVIGLSIFVLIERWKTGQAFFDSGVSN